VFGRLKGDFMKKIIAFFKESYGELKKVIWPGRDEVLSSTKVVVISSIIIAVILGLFDLVLVYGIRQIA
jgi:preprotein translocase subunit SecE